MNDSTNTSGWMESVNKQLAIFAGALGAKIIAGNAVIACAEAGLEDDKQAYVSRVAQAIGNPARQAEFLASVEKL